MVLRMDNQAPKTISVPQAGKQYFGLAKNASYEAEILLSSLWDTDRLGRLIVHPVNHPV